MRRAKKSNTSIFNTKNKIFCISVIVIIIAAVITIININSTGSFPWGESTYGYLSKSKLIYEDLINNNMYSDFSENWYNGIHILRGSEPLTYYLLAIITLFTKDILITFNIYVILLFILGAMGFLLWGYYFNRQRLALFFSITWFFVPSNLKMLFSEGNLSIALINAMVPYLILIYYKSTKENKKSNYYLISALFMGLVLIDIKITIAILAFLWIVNLGTFLIGKGHVKRLKPLTVATLGVGLTGFWIIPAIKNGILNISEKWSEQALERTMHPLMQSINPLERFNNIEIYYFGISFIFVAIFGIVLSKNNYKEKRGFCIAVIMFICTSSSLLVFFKKLPFNEFLLISQMTSIAIGLIFWGVIKWKNLKKIVLIACCFIISLDCMMSFEGLGVNRNFPEQLVNALDEGSKYAVQRVGVLDGSTYGSFPSYYLTEKFNKEQIFGWGYENAATKSNIVTINTALENSYFMLMFDRSLELGADTLVIKKSFIKDFEELNKCAEIVGYEKKYEDEGSIIYSYPVNSSFGTKVKYEGIAIGEYASNIMYNFPKFYSGKSEFIDDYDIDELKEYKSIFLSGFKYHNKLKAEELIEELTKEGVRVVIDIIGLEQSGFLGIQPQSVDLKGNYGEVYYEGERVEFEDFPTELSHFRCNFIKNVENTESYSLIDTLVAKYIHHYNEDLIFVGMNLPFYSMKTKDEQSIKILEEALNVEAYTLPEREIVNVFVNYENENEISIKAEKEGTLIPLAILDSFQCREGNFNTINNLIKIEGERLVFTITDEDRTVGKVVSVITLICLVLFITKFDKGKSSKGGCNG